MFCQVPFCPRLSLSISATSKTRTFCSKVTEKASSPGDTRGVKITSTKSPLLRVLPTAPSLSTLIEIARLKLGMKNCLSIVPSSGKTTWSSFMRISISALFRSGSPWGIFFLVINPTTSSGDVNKLGITSKTSTCTVLVVSISAVIWVRGGISWLATTISVTSVKLFRYLYVANAMITANTKVIISLFLIALFTF